MAWALDNRTVGFRVVGEGKSFRIENRMPGADANPYLAFAAMLAAGMAGIDEATGLRTGLRRQRLRGSATARLAPLTRQAAELLDGSKLARAAFGDEVVDFYIHTARLEAEAFNNAVTDWERRRYFERI